MNGECGVIEEAALAEDRAKLVQQARGSVLVLICLSLIEGVAAARKTRLWTGWVRGRSGTPQRPRCFLVVPAREVMFCKDRVYGSGCGTRPPSM
jgi:hypothetical protein